MFETDRIPAGWDMRLNGMDEVWVPSMFNRRTFEEGGTESHRLHVVGEPVDISFFDPSRVTAPFELPKLDNTADTTVFLSVFKWEERKGWDVLLESYIREFSNIDDNGKDKKKKKKENKKENKKKNKKKKKKKKKKVVFLVFLLNHLMIVLLLINLINY